MEPLDRSRVDARRVHASSMDRVNFQAANFQRPNGDLPTSNAKRQLSTDWRLGLRVGKLDIVHLEVGTWPLGIDVWRARLRCKIAAT
jgi:hypothetical protein